MRHIRVVLILTAALCSGTACSAEPSKSIYVEELSCDRGPMALRLGKTLTELRNVRGFSDEKTERRKESGTEARVLTFDGLALKVVVIPSTDEVLVEELIVSKPRPDVTGKIGIGTSLAELSAVLKRKIVAQPTVKICGDADCLVLGIESDRIRAMRYTCYTG